jgi:hypothetical protein
VLQLAANLVARLEKHLPGEQTSQFKAAIQSDDDAHLAAIRLALSRVSSCVDRRKGDPADDLARLSAHVSFVTLSGHLIFISWPKALLSTGDVKKPDLLYM